MRCSVQWSGPHDAMFGLPRMARPRSARTTGGGQISSTAPSTTPTAVPNNCGGPTASSQPAVNRDRHPELLRPSLCKCDRIGSHELRVRDPHFGKPKTAPAGDRWNRCRPGQRPAVTAPDRWNRWSPLHWSSRWSSKTADHLGSSKTTASQWAAQTSTGRRPGRLLHVLAGEASTATQPPQPAPRPDHLRTALIARR